MEEMDIDSCEEYEEDSGNESCHDQGDDITDKEDDDDEMNADEVYPYTVLSPKDIVDHMSTSIQNANTVLQLPFTTMQILLNHFAWNREKLMDCYYDGDQEKLFKDAGLVDPSFIEQVDEITPTEDCQICYLTKDSHLMFAMGCGHRFCKECWREYLTAKITGEGASALKCPAHKCQILVDKETVTEIIQDSSVIVKYQHFITNGFVSCNRLMRWCPSNNCSNAILVQWVDFQPVKCSCNFTFCYKCAKPWHGPIQCAWLKKWLKKCEDDSETSNWLVANTKDCPKCGAIIEKNGGCNHMSCMNLNCKAEFCWICKGPWNKHQNQAGYACNVYDESKKKAQVVSRAALERYLFYFTRYINHMQSLKLENKLYKDIKEKMDFMQELDTPWIEVQFLNTVWSTAVDVLCQSRQTLMYTYAFAFYLEKNNETAIFEDNQADLEVAIEKLSGFLEREVDSETWDDLKLKVQDQYRYVDSRRKVLLNHVHEGYNKDKWTYNANL